MPERGSLREVIFSIQRFIRTDLALHRFTGSPPLTTCCGARTLANSSRSRLQLQTDHLRIGIAPNYGRLYHVKALRKKARVHYGQLQVPALGHPNTPAGHRCSNSTYGHTYKTWRASDAGPLWRIQELECLSSCNKGLRFSGRARIQCCFAVGEGRVITSVITATGCLVLHKRSKLRVRYGTTVEAQTARSPRT